MKNSAILDILNGVKGNRETFSMPLKERQALNTVCDAYDELKKQLSPEQFSLHEKFVAALEKCHYEETGLYFAEGFKLGLLIGVESTETE